MSSRDITKNSTEACSFSNVLEYEEFHASYMIRVISIEKWNRRIMKGL